MADRYRNFAALSRGEIEGTDYRIEAIDRNSSVILIAPHGGYIEPGTSEIAAAIAGDKYSFYAFEGLHRGRRHGDLHITSSRFDEPRALELVHASESAVAIHGRADDGDNAVWIGGGCDALARVIAARLFDAGFPVAVAAKGLAGKHLLNICNRGTVRGGAQLELTRFLRNTLVGDPDLLKRFSFAVRAAIDEAFDADRRLICLRPAYSVTIGDRSTKTRCGPAGGVPRA